MPWPLQKLQTRVCFIRHQQDQPRRVATCKAAEIVKHTMAPMHYLNTGAQGCHPHEHLLTNERNQPTQIETGTGAAETYYRRNNCNFQYLFLQSQWQNKQLGTEHWNGHYQTSEKADTEFYIAIESEFSIAITSILEPGKSKALYIA